MHTHTHIYIKFLIIKDKSILYNSMTGNISAPKVSLWHYFQTNTCQHPLPKMPVGMNKPAHFKMCRPQKSLNSHELNWSSESCPLYQQMAPSQLLYLVQEENLNGIWPLFLKQKEHLVICRTRHPATHWKMPA